MKEKEYYCPGCKTHIKVMCNCSNAYCKKCKLYCIESNGLIKFKYPKEWNLKYYKKYYKLEKKLNLKAYGEYIKNLKKSCETVLNGEYNAN